MCANKKSITSNSVAMTLCIDIRIIYSPNDNFTIGWREELSRIKARIWRALYIKNLPIMVCWLLVGGKMHFLGNLFAFSTKMYFSAVSVVAVALGKEVLSVAILAANQAPNVLVQSHQKRSHVTVSVTWLNIKSFHQQRDGKNWMN